MKKILSALLLPIILMSGFDTKAVEETTASNETSKYMSVSVDKVVIDTKGLVLASAELADSIERLADSIERLAGNSEALNPEEKKILLNAATSVDKASLALAELALRLPETADRLTEQLPQMVENARAPIAELSAGLETASDGVLAITQSLPEATENARALVNSTLDAALIRVTVFAVILLFAFALVLGLIGWFIYQRYLEPFARIFNPLVEAPGHLDNLSKHMKQTSDNLLALQTISESQHKDEPGAEQEEFMDSDKNK